MCKINIFINKFYNVNLILMKNINFNLYFSKIKVL